MIDEGSSVDAIHLDYAKAFDSLPHERLLKKFEALGAEGDTLQWIRDFLVGRRPRAIVNKSVSDWAAVKVAFLRAVFSVPSYSWPSLMMFCMLMTRKSMVQ